MSSDPSETTRSKLEALCDQFLPAGTVSADLRGQFVSQVEHLLLQAKLESLAEFAAGAGHEINNPVATIVGRAQLLLAGESDPERRHALEVIGGQALRIRDMIGDTMLFARPPAPRVEQLSLAELARQAVESQAGLQAAVQASITVNVNDGITIRGDRTQVLVLLSSLVRNSLEAAGRAGLNFCLMARTEIKAGTQWVVLTASDDGPGFSASEREHLFDPFYSGRQAGRGLGFGLSKCWRIAQMHGGEIFAREGQNGGAVLEVWWPSPSDQARQ